MSLDFKSIPDNTPPLFQQIYSILGARKASSIVQDSDAPLVHSVDDIKEIQALTYQHTLDQRALAGDSFNSLDEVRKSFAADAFYNPMTNIGTRNDPSAFNTVNIPVAMSPYEASALFASGGLAEIIVNKKSKGVLLNGYDLQSNDPFWTVDKVKRIKDKAQEKNFESILAQGILEGYIYGGAVVYPTLQKDRALSFDFTTKELAAKSMLEKDCIAYWSAVDRWNTTFIPNYNIAAQDYLFAKQYYIPLAGVSVKTERSAVIRPKKQPYWSAIQQLGWGTSDFEGYIRSIYGYQIMIASIPIMAQQMSLLMYEIPLDGMMAQAGVASMKEFLALNDEQMREWSMANPKTINALGKVYTVNRTYTGYNDLAIIIRQDICAQAGLDEALLFHTQAKGFTSDTEEALLKQSETVRIGQKQISPSVQPLKNFLVYDTFGYNSEEGKHANSLLFTFDNPEIATETERAESAARFAATVNSLKQANVPADKALMLAKEFFSGVEVSVDVINAAKERDQALFDIAVKESQQKTATDVKPKDNSVKEKKGDN